MLALSSVAADGDGPAQATRRPPPSVARAVAEPSRPRRPPPTRSRDARAGRRTEPAPTTEPTRRTGDRCPAAGPGSSPTSASWSPTTAAPTPARSACWGRPRPTDGQARCAPPRPVRAARQRGPDRLRADRHGRRRAPGEDGDFSHDIARADVQRYIDAAHRARRAAAPRHPARPAGFLSVVAAGSGRSRTRTSAWRSTPSGGWAAAACPASGSGRSRATEVDRVSNWLSTLVRIEKLPQKLFVLHQFRTDMIEDIEDISAARRPGDGPARRRLRHPGAEAGHLPRGRSGRGSSSWASSCSTTRTSGCCSPASCAAIRPTGAVRQLPVARFVRGPICRDVRPWTGGVHGATVDMRRCPAMSRRHTFRARPASTDRAATATRIGFSSPWSLV